VIEATCPECKRPLSLPDELAGKTVRCPKCQSNVAIPFSTPAAFSEVLPAAVTEPPNTSLLTADITLPEKRLEEINPRLEVHTVRPDQNTPLRTATLFKRWQVILFLSILSIPIGVGAWLLAGGDLWVILGLIGSGIGALALLIVLARQRTLGLGRGKMAALVMYAVVLEGMWWLLGLNLSQSDVYVDNFSSRTLHVELDGRPWLTCTNKTTTPKVLRHGLYHLVVRAVDNDEVLDERDVFVEGLNLPFVLNLLGAQKYYRGSVQYGGIIAFNDQTPTEIHDVWIKADVDFLLRDPPSSIDVHVRKGQASYLATAEKTYLTRGQPPPR
jgi:hypothetical protein